MLEERILAGRAMRFVFPRLHECPAHPEYKILAESVCLILNREQQQAWAHLEDMERTLDKESDQARFLPLYRALARPPEESRGEKPHDRKTLIEDDAGRWRYSLDLLREFIDINKDCPAFVVDALTPDIAPTFPGSVVHPGIPWFGGCSMKRDTAPIRISEVKCRSPAV